MEVILALVLGRVMAHGPEAPIAVDCVSLLEEMRATGLDPVAGPFPDPSLLDEVIGILTEKAPQTWRPYVISGGKTDPMVQV